MPRENKISSTFPFLYDRQRQEMGDQNKGGVRKQHIPHKLTTNLDISRLKTQKKTKSKTTTGIGGGGLFCCGCR